jgi:serine/threonine protein kinase
MSNEELAKTILERLDGQFPDATNFQNLYDFVQRKLPNVPQQECLKSLDALLRLGMIEGTPLREGTSLIALGNILIAPKGRQELGKTQTSKQQQSPGTVRLSHEERQILLQITGRLLNHLMGTSINSLRRSLGPSRSRIDALLTKQLLRVVGGDYLPTFRGVECLDDDIRGIVDGNVDSTFRALQRLYRQSHQNTFTFAAVVEEARRTDPARDARDVLPALLLGEEFGFYYFQSGIHQNDERLSIDQITVYETIMDYSTLDAALGPTNSRGEGRRPVGLARPALDREGDTIATPTLTNWEILEQLGEGGQSQVWKVRRPNRVDRRNALRDALTEKFNSVLPIAANSPDKITQIAELAYEYARPETVLEIAALKRFKIPENRREANEALGRLKNEISILRKRLPGLLQLVEANESEGWILTEFMPRGTLERQPSTYKGKPHKALKAFQSLVETVAALHKDGVVHRDIKPANVFLGHDDRLVLGDLGIVYLPDQTERLTTTNERVGPRDYMPPWGDLGQRLESVRPNFDVYMLGKLLWCMVSGCLRLPREYHRRPEYDITVLFPNDHEMRTINAILERCVVENPDACLPSAQELLQIVAENLAVLERGVPMLDQNGQFIRRCRMCGRGTYQDLFPQGSFRISRVDNMGRPMGEILVRIFGCDVCHHQELFAPGHPDEAALRGWGK